MNSSRFPTEDEVIEDLGTDFVKIFVESVDGASADFEELRAWRPGWASTYTSRHTASFLHERIWARMVSGIDGVEGFEIIDREPKREIHFGIKYQIRVKRHRPGDRISAVQTVGNRRFWTNFEQTFDGLEQFSLALGYMWDAEQRSVEYPVLSFRDGQESPIWAVRLEREDDNALGFRWESVESPDLPDVDLGDIAVENEEEEDTGS
ncbi:hypothetical protein [Zhihengliuella sp.]|uniref:hypothetical protein n=1 Tax=Zhihengliuella sp. TaxID=1954483 RepID=UPI002810BD23|nr:hypothetical protein [Zhihengliuella sp.]